MVLARVFASAWSWSGGPLWLWRPDSIVRLPGCWPHQPAARSSARQPAGSQVADCRAQRSDVAGIPSALCNLALCAEPPMRTASPAAVLLRRSSAHQQRRSHRHLLRHIRHHATHSLRQAISTLAAGGDALQPRGRDRSRRDLQRRVVGLAVPRLHSCCRGGHQQGRVRREAACFL
jgi:hypothetical protein